MTLKLVTLGRGGAGPGDEGEIRIKGPQVFRGYIDSSLDADAFDPDGFFRAATSAIVDADGYVTITGRLKDVIIRNGENISAKEVEDLLYSHPVVADVAVIGLPDPKTGERACAVVAVKDGQSALSFVDMHGYLTIRASGPRPFPSSSRWSTPCPGTRGQDLEAHVAPAVLLARRARPPRLPPRPGGIHESHPTVTLGRGGTEHDAADAAISSFTGHRFADRVAVVTGAGSGIGRAVAVRLAKEGAKVAALDVAEENVAATVESITADGGTAVAFGCDVTSEPSVEATVAEVVDRLGPPRVVCNVAGIGGFYRTEEMPLQRWEQILAVNLTGPFLVCRATLPHLLEHGGSIVNVASNTALTGQSYSAAYCALQGRTC